LAARSVGMMAVSLTGSVSSREKLLAHRPHLLIDSLSYIVLFSGVSLVAGLVGGLSAPRAEEAVPVSFEAEAGVEKRETEGVEVEARPREAAVQIPGEIVYVKCPHCGRRVKPE
jgi:hypothetical protein